MTAKGGVDVMMFCLAKTLPGLNPHKVSLRVVIFSLPIGSFSSGFFDRRDGGADD